MSTLHLLRAKYWSSWPMEISKRRSRLPKQLLPVGRSCRTRCLTVRGKEVPSLRTIWPERACKHFTLYTSPGIIILIPPSILSRSSYRLKSCLDRISSMMPMRRLRAPSMPYAFGGGGGGGGAKTAEVTLFNKLIRRENPPQGVCLNPAPAPAPARALGLARPRLPVSAAGSRWSC